MEVVVVLVLLAEVWDMEVMILAVTDTSVAAVCGLQPLVYHLL